MGVKVVVFSVFSVYVSILTSAVKQDLFMSLQFIKVQFSVKTN